MKKRVLSFLLAVCMVLSIAPMPAYAEAVPTYYCGEEHTHTDTCLVDPNGAAPASEEEPQEEPPTCTCDTACAAGAMNTACAVCGAGGAGVEGCGKYVAPAPDEEPQEEPPTCTCETACAAGAMNTACAVCGAGGATVEGCGKYEEPTDDTPAGDGAYEIDTAEKLLQFSSGETGLNAVLTADITLPSENTLTIPSGATLTVPEGMTLTVQGGVENNGSIVVNGTIVLPANMNKYLVMNLGITGTGDIKFGKAHIGTDGDCITHNWDARIKQKDTTQHYTMGCRTCNINDEATVAACEYDNVCDTDCNICKIVRTVPHQYDENGFCTVCRYSDSAAVDSDGDGYVEIDTAGKLWWFTHQVNNGQYDLNAELTANIDLAGTCGAGIGNWLPISHEEGYAGKFNGQGFTVSNLYITGDGLYVGLFGYVKRGTIENVTVTGSVSSTFYTTYDPDTYEIFDGSAGGVVGYLDGGTIRNCESAVTVTGGYYFGGICGQMLSGSVEDCINRGTIICFQDSTNQVQYGGIVGFFSDGTVRGCTNHGEVTVGTRQKYVTNVGGIVGSSSYGTIENCINMSSIVGSDTSTGGIAGKNWVYATIRNCGNIGTVTGDWVGGITGSNEGIIEHSWNVAAVSGTSEYVGPIAGYISTDFGNMTSNYYLSDTETTDGGRTAEAFASGQVAYELNGSTTTDASVWRQTLGTDSYPTLSGELVYHINSQKCDGTVLGSAYSNTSGDTVVHDDADANGFCDECGKLPITDATFPDANFRAYIAENFDTDKDNALSPDEIAAVTILNVKGLGINDITGLAYFTELVELYAGGNAFGAIDLSTLKKLRVLNLESCAYLRQLDVSALGDLEELYMRDCHYVTSLNLERNGYLTYLDIERSGIKSLDVSKNVSLLSLNIQDTGITSLDLSNNPGAGLLMGENTTYRDFQHCGVGYLNMSQFGDTSRMTVMEGGTLGADGWIKLDAGATKIVYEYDLQNDPQNAARLFVEIIIDNRGIDHNYVANAISKDETGHYAQFCTTCRTGNEETFAPHTLDENGVCTANCGFACTHGYDHTDSGMCSLCGKQRLFLVTVGGTGHYFDSLEDALAKAAEGTADAPAAVKLLTDLTHTGQSVEIAKGAHVTLDLNGFTLDMGSEAIWNYGSLELRDSRGGGQLTGSGRFTVDSNGSFTLTSGTVSNINSEWDTSAVRLGNYGEMIMNGGTVQGAANGIYAIVDSRITINAGTVIGTGYSGIYSNTGELLVNGGEIRGYGYGIESIHSNVHITGGIVDGYLLNANGTLLLSGGTVTGSISTYPATLADCLAPGLFFHDANGDPIALAPDQDYIAVPVTVAECAHIDRVGDHICDVCGETVSQCADENNDHKCDVCGTVLSQCTGGTATCVAQAVCTICGQPYGELDPDNHSGAADKLASNGDGTHNASYSCCGVPARENVPCTPADCTKESLCACGYSMAATQTEHDFSGAYAYDENGHRRKCLYCEVVGPWEEHFGQSTGQGCEAAILCDCGYVMVPAKGHSSNTLFFGIDDHYHYEGCSTCTLPVNDKTYPHNFTETNYNDDEHWYICADCQWEGEKQVHTYGEDRTCVCGAEKPREAVELTITWTATEFTYVDGEWNPDTHEYNEGEWIGECTVTLENTGVEDVAYSVTYMSTVDGITGVFCTTENPKADSVTGTLAADEKKVITFKPDGKPSKALDNEKIGTLTIKLGGD